MDRNSAEMKCQAVPLSRDGGARTQRRRAGGVSATASGKSVEIKGSRVASKDHHNNSNETPGTTARVFQVPLNCVSRLVSVRLRPSMYRRETSTLARLEMANVTPEVMPILF